MKKITNASIPIILTFSLVLLLSTGSANIYGQLIDQTNQTNQTSGQNTTQQTQQQANQSKQQDPELGEKLLRAYPKIR